MSAKKFYTVKLKLRVTQAQVEEYFQLDSPGYYIAREALKAGEIATPIQQLETICLANQLYAQILVTHMLEALNPYGKGAEYLEKRNTEEVGDFVVGILGKEHAEQILRDVMAEVRREAKIGTGENDQATRKRAAKRRPESL